MGERTSPDYTSPRLSAPGILGWIQNDFERVVFPQHPPLCEIKRLLASADMPEAALHASLSGSGSALFGLYLTRGAGRSSSRTAEPVHGGFQCRAL